MGDDARSDHQTILDLLTDDVVREIHGHRRTVGKAEFDAEIENENVAASPKLQIDRVIAAGDTVVVRHVGEVLPADGTPFRFAACDILTVERDRISRVESWVVPTGRPPGTWSSPPLRGGGAP